MKHDKINVAAEFADELESAGELQLLQNISGPTQPHEALPASREGGERTLAPYHSFDNSMGLREHMRDVAHFDSALETGDGHFPLGSLLKRRLARPFAIMMASLSTRWRMRGIGQSSGTIKDV